VVPSRDRGRLGADAGGDAVTTPVTIDQAALRIALGHFPTGVAAVCARDSSGEPVGLAANSFTSVSLDPPLVLFCIANTSSTWQRMQTAAAFAISILAADHEPVCRTLATKGIDRFAALDWSEAPSRAPVIDGSLAWFDCETVQRHPAGDHEIVVGEVSAFGITEEELMPLVFHRSRFGVS
jgi:3-hydroxy-9,10-secoandrosta-1,3,5(10)-triene-9,17-dione monooxygenase reductase component